MLSVTSLSTAHIIAQTLDRKASARWSRRRSRSKFILLVQKKADLVQKKADSVRLFCLYTLLSSSHSLWFELDLKLHVSRATFDVQCHGVARFMVSDDALEVLPCADALTVHQLDHIPRLDSILLS